MSIFKIQGIGLHFLLFLFFHFFHIGQNHQVIAYKFIPPTATNLNLPEAILPQGLKLEIPVMKAWSCHGRSNGELVEKLALAQIVKTRAVQEALLKVDRVNYVNNKKSAYDDSPQPLGLGQTISAPHMHAHALEQILPTLVVRQKNIKERLQAQNINYSLNTSLKILDVGCGSGYLSSCFGRLVEEDKNELGLKGTVFGIDVLPNLVALSESNAKKKDSDLIQNNIISFQEGDGWNGLKSEAPFDAIHVGAAAEDFPTKLLMQLNIGGRMICPVGPNGGIQCLYRIDRVKQSSDDNLYDVSDFIFKELLGVRYVPLVKR